MVTWPSRLRRKIIIWWHWPAGSAEKKLYGGIGQPAQHQNSLTKWWDTAFPLVGNLPKNYMAATLGKLYGGIWPGCPEKNIYGDIGQPGPQKKIIWWHWLPAGTLTCHHIIIFSAKNYIYLIFARNRMPWSAPRLIGRCQGKLC